MRPARPSRPAALAGGAAVLAAAALAVSITTAVTAPPAPAASPSFFRAPNAVPELSVGVSCVPGTNTGTATVYVGAHTSSAPWQAALTDAPADRAGGGAVHPFREWGKSQVGWTAPYPVTGRGVLTLASDQSWVAVEMGTVPYDCHP